MVREVDEETFDAILRHPRTIVMFYQDGCPACSQSRPVFERASRKYADVKFFATKSDPLCDRFKVSETPTFVFFEKHVPKFKMTGSISAKRLRSFLDRLTGRMSWKKGQSQWMQCFSTGDTAS